MPERSESVWSRIVARLSGRDELRSMARSIRDHAATHEHQTAALQSRLAALSELVSQRSTTKDAHEIFHTLRAILTALEDRTGDAVGSLDERPSTIKLFRALDDIARGDAPIVAGPWTGEVGFELLYWIPFLEWFRTRWRVSPERFVIVSRGGVAAWYGMPAARYVDIFSVVPVETFRERAPRDKQRNESVFDQELVRAVSEQCGLRDAKCLHPQLMYRTLGPLWKDEAGFGLLSRFTIHRTIEPMSDPLLRDLPDDFVAVRFYFSNCFPDKPANRTAAQGVVKALAEQTAVVILNPGVRVDDHVDYAPDHSGRVTTLPAIPAERNLAMQSAVVSRARAFVGTYGGYSYVAPFCGVPSIGFYSQPSFKLHHLYVAQRVLEQLGAPAIVALDIAQADLVHAATAGSAHAVIDGAVGGVTRRVDGVTA